MKRELQSQYVKRQDLEAEFDNLEDLVEDELGFHSSLEAKCAEIKARLRERIIGSLDRTDVNIDLEDFNTISEKTPVIVNLKPAGEMLMEDLHYAGGVSGILKNIDDLIPKTFITKKKYKKTGKAGIFAGSLELVKEGNIKIKQDTLFGDLFVREN